MVYAVISWEIFIEILRNDKINSENWSSISHIKSNRLWFVIFSPSAGWVLFFTKIHSDLATAPNKNCTDLSTANQMRLLTFFKCFYSISFFSFSIRMLFLVLVLISSYSNHVQLRTEQYYSGYELLFAINIWINLTCCYWNWLDLTSLQNINWWKSILFSDFDAMFRHFNQIYREITESNCKVTIGTWFTWFTWHRICHICNWTKMVLEWHDF